MARIDVFVPGFLARRDLPPVVLPLQQVLLEVAAAPREEIAFSCLTLEDEIDKFHFEEEEAQEAQIVYISDAEDELDKYSGVHTLTLVIARPDSTFEEEEDEMALNQGNKSLRDLIAQNSFISFSCIFSSTNQKFSSKPNGLSSQVPLPHTHQTELTK